MAIMVSSILNFLKNDCVAQSLITQAALSSLTMLLVL